MTDPFTITQFAGAFWGDRPGQVPFCLEAHPPFGEASPEQLRHVRSSLRIRLDPEGGLHLLPNVPPGGDRNVPILHFDAGGQATGTTPLPAEGLATAELAIVDYAVDAEGHSFLLEQVRLRSGRSESRLRKLSAGGDVLWSRSGPTALEPSSRLLIDERSRVYMPLAEPASGLAEIDASTGSTARVLTFEPRGGELFAAGDGTALYTLFFQDLNRRGVGTLDLASGRVETLVGSEALYAWLVYPFGADASSNLYVWRDSTIARISFAGELEPVAAFDSLVVRIDAIYASCLRAQRPAVLQVSRYAATGPAERIDVAVPPKFEEIRDWLLVQVDSERLFFFGGERPGRAGTLLLASREGRFEEAFHPPGDLLPLESATERFPQWQVDSRGRIYVPVTDPEGVKVVRLQPGNSTPGVR